MKTAIRQLNAFSNTAPFPNALTPRQLLHKALDVLLVAACGMGIGAMFLLALVLS